MQDLNITLVQSDLFWEDIDKNLSRFDEKIASINRNTQLVVLPEMFSTGFTMNAEKMAEPMNGKAMTWLRDTARKRKTVIAGSLLIRENGRFYNRFVAMKPDGSFEYYDKRHLFSMVGEHKVMTSGTAHTIVHLNGWKLNLMVCYDLRFPVWSMNRYDTGNHEYDILVYVANWPEIRSYAYKSLLTARAIENQSYVIWVNRIGSDENGKIYSGDSMVVDPTGKILTHAGPHQSQLLCLKLSKADLHDIRSKFKFAEDWDRFAIHD